VTGEGRADLLVRDGKERTLTMEYGTMQRPILVEMQVSLEEVAYPQRGHRGSDTVVRTLREDMGLGSSNAPVMKETAYAYKDEVCDGELGCLGPTYRISTTEMVDEEERNVVKTRVERYEHTRHADAHRYLTSGVVEVAESVVERVLVNDGQGVEPHAWVAWSQTTPEVVATDGSTYRVQT